MLKTLAIIAAFGMLTVAVPTAYAQKIDANGKCHAKDGKFAKMEVCKGAAPAAPAMKAGPAMKAAPAPVAAPTGYTLDAKGKCHGKDGKMAKKEMCKA